MEPIDYVGALRRSWRLVVALAVDVGQLPGQFGQRADHRSCGARDDSRISIRCRTLTLSRPTPQRSDVSSQEEQPGLVNSRNSARGAGFRLNRQWKNGLRMRLTIAVRVGIITSHKFVGKHFYSQWRMYGSVFP